MCTMGVEEHKRDRHDCKGIMGNAKLYQRLIQGLIDHGWKRYLKKHSKIEDQELTPLVNSVYRSKHDVKKRINTLHAMLRNHRKKIKKDIKMHLKKPREMLYPPNHEIHTQNKLFPFLDRKISEIFKPDQFPLSVPKTVLREATQYMNHNNIGDDNVLENSINYLKSQSVKWLAMKLLPENYHSHITSNFSLNRILKRVSNKANITMDALKFQVGTRYEEIKSELCIINDTEKEISIDEIEYSQVAVASDVPMNEVDCPSKELMNEEMTEEKFIIESDACDVEITAKDSAGESVGILSDDESVYSMKYLDDNITTDVPIGEADYPPMEPMNNDIREETIISESDVYGAKINENDSVDDCTSILSNDESVYFTEYLEDTVAADVSIEGADNSPQEQTNDGIVEENTEIEPSTFNEKNIFGNGTMNNFHQDDNSNPHNNQGVDGTSSQIHELSLNKQSNTLTTCGSMDEQLNNLLLERMRLMNVIENEMRIVEEEMKEIMAKHLRFQKVMTKKVEMMEFVAMTKHRRMLKLMVKILRNRRVTPLRN